MKKLKLNYSNLTPLPSNFLVEQAVLNILLTSPNLIKSSLSALKINSFYFLPHQLIYEAILELNEKNNSFNLTILVSYLQDKNLLTEIGGMETLIKIISRFENFSDLETYIKILNEKYLRRLIIEFGKEIIGLGYLNKISIEEIIQKIESSLFYLSHQNENNKLYSSAEILDDIFKDIKIKINQEDSNGLKTSYKDLDSILQGFQKSDLIIIAGRPSMGKTAFSLNLGKKIVEKYNLPLIIFSLEMSRQQIIYRFISNDCKINSNRLKTNKMTSEEWKKLSLSMLKLSKLPIFIDDNPNLTLSDIRSKLRKIFGEKKKTGIVIIDYLQLMKLNVNMENRVQEISYLTRNLKMLAKEFDIPILVLSQLSRSVESRLNKRPMLSDLRESGCLSTLKFDSNFFSWNKTKIIKNNNLFLEFKGIKPTFLITFENNTKICLTANHKILSNKGWIKIFEIQRATKIYYLRNYTNCISYDFYTVQSIKYIGLNKVYDKEIPEYHNYIKNNIILHNSIEQDADIVIMLYREDYYIEKLNTDNITEFIVAKHRNGPVGTARLIFNPEFTSFENI
jgi:replicative DNA helicase